MIAIYPCLEDSEEVLEILPSVYVDINRMTLMNLFPEPSGMFENYVPAGWDSSCEDFLHLIPQEDIYWVFDEKSRFGVNA